MYQHFAFSYRKFEAACQVVTPGVPEVVACIDFMRCNKLQECTEQDNAEKRHHQKMSCTAYALNVRMPICCTGKGKE